MLIGLAVSRRLLAGLCRRGDICFQVLIKIHFILYRYSFYRISPPLGSLNNVCRRQCLHGLPSIGRCFQEFCGWKYWCHFWRSRLPWAHQQVRNRGGQHCVVIPTQNIYKIPTCNFKHFARWIDVRSKLNLYETFIYIVSLQSIFCPVRSDFNKRVDPHLL